MAINFPNSPIAGEYFVTGNLTYQYTGTVWVSVNTKTNNAFNQANTAFDKANTANVIASAAFNKANGAAQLSFTTIVANGTSLVADSNADTLTIRTTGNVAITADASGDNLTFDLTTTGVTATTYGNATIIPVITVDSRGRLTSVSNVTVVSSTPTNSIVYVSDTAPSGVSNGTLWWNSNSATLYINYGDGDTTQWISTSEGAFGTITISSNAIAVAAFDKANAAVLKTGNTMTGNLVMSSANIAFATSVNNGIYWNGTSFIHSPEANVLIFGTSAVEDFRIDSNGNLNVAVGLYVTGTVSDSKANVLSQTLSDSASISWDASLGRIATVTLGGARTLANATNIRVGTYVLKVQQNTTGNSTLTFGTQYKFTANVTPTLTSAANSVDIFSFVCDGTNMYGAMIPDVRS